MRKQPSVSTGSANAAARSIGGATFRHDLPQFQQFLSGSAPIALDGIDWDAIGEYALSDDVVRIFLYMQRVESHTVVFLRTILSRRAVKNEIFGTILICWLYEEGMH